MNEVTEVTKIAVFKGKAIRKTIYNNKWWLARVGYERVQEIEDSERAMKRIKAIYEQKGYPKDWIEKRVRGIAVRNELTDEWKNRDVTESLAYAILTNDIMKGVFEKDWIPAYAGMTIEL